MFIPGSHTVDESHQPLSIHTIPQDPSCCWSLWCHNWPCQQVDIALHKHLMLPIVIGTSRTLLWVKKTSKFWEAIFNHWWHHQTMRYLNYSHTIFTNSLIATELKNSTQQKNVPEQQNKSSRAHTSRRWNWEMMPHDYWAPQMYHHNFTVPQHFHLWVLE